MIEWDGILNTIKTFTMLTDKKADIIIQYLRAHTIDGYANDDKDEE